MFILATTVLTDPIHHFTSHWSDMITGATILAIVAHAVQSFPPPTNPYGQWALGVVQFAVGQRLRASNTMQGNPTK